MSRIFLSSDIHGHIDIWKLNSEHFPEGKNLTKDDYVIILGDFGLVWDNDKQELYWRKWLNNKPWTTLFVDGNHDHIPFINQFPIEEWNGGKIHRISDSIYHLMRGQVFNIYGKLFMTMGGAYSIDKEYRVEGISWWKEELPDRLEYEELLSNLDKVNYKVDYVLTHTCPLDLMQLLSIVKLTGNNDLERFFLHLKNDLDYKKWYFGHFHVDKNIDDKHRAIYNDIIELDLY